MFVYIGENFQSLPVAYMTCVLVLSINYRWYIADGIVYNVIKHWTQIMFREHKSLKHLQTRYLQRSIGFLLCLSFLCSFLL